MPKMEAAISGTAGDPAQRLAQALQFQGVNALGAGKNVEAARSLMAASTILKNDVAMKTQQAKVQTNKIDTALGLLETGNLQTAMMLYQQKYHEPIPQSLINFAANPQNNNPATIERFRKAHLSQKDRINLAEKQAVITKDAAETSLAEKTSELRDKQIKEEKVREHNLVKAGSPTKEVPSWALQAVVDLAHRKFQDNADTSTLRAVSRAAAQRAAFYASQGMSEQQAADKAFREADSAGTYAGIKLPMATPGSMRAPIPLNKDTKPESNLYYIFPDGRVGLWTGKNFSVVQK
jgi:NACalpha-BTF3-like transcription factor